MPTILTHPVVAVGLAPAFWGRGVTRSVLGLGALSAVVPDLDAIGFRLGVPYDAPLGHRGFSHSLAFAAAWSGLLWIALRYGRSTSPGLGVFVDLFLCTASHGVFDAFTNGGLGVAFFAPFSNERFFFPWRPIKVSPISISRFLSGRGIQVLRSELVWVVAPSIIGGIVGWLVSRVSLERRS